MNRRIFPIAFLCASAWALSSRGGFAEGGPSFALAGDLDSSVAYSIENADSVFAGRPPVAGVDAGGTIEGKLSFSRQYTSLGLLDFSFRDASLLSHGDGSTLESASFQINEFYADLNLGDLLYLRLGKQRLSWGAGYVFNPSDPVNPPKNPTDQRAILEGVPALKAELIAKPISLMAFAVLYDELEETGYGAKLSTSAIKDSDISVSGYWSPSQSWTTALNASISPFYDLPGWDGIQLWFEGSVYGAPRYALYAVGSQPGAVATAAAESTQYAILAGGSAQVPGLKSVALAEYYHLSEGMSREELGSVYRALRDPATRAASSAWYSELARRPGRQASDYLFVSLSQPTITDSGNPVFDKIGLSASCLVDLADLSIYASGDLALTFVKDSSVDLIAAWAEGGADSEFGNAPHRFSLTMEVKVFF